MDQSDINLRQDDSGLIKAGVVNMLRLITMLKVLHKNDVDDGDGTYLVVLTLITAQIIII